MSAKIVSFGFSRRSLKPQADKVVDVRELTHNLDAPEASKLIEDVCSKYEAGQTIAIGCEKGKHRSVVLADRIAKQLGLRVYHRDK